jgi:hypothetical protein
LLFISDGVLRRRTFAGAPLGLDGARSAIPQRVDPAAAWTVRALEDAMTAASSDPLEDDATVVVFAFHDSRLERSNWHTRVSYRGQMTHTAA